MSRPIKPENIIAFRSMMKKVESFEGPFSTKVIAKAVKKSKVSARAFVDWAERNGKIRRTGETLATGKRGSQCVAYELIETQEV